MLPRFPPRQRRRMRDIVLTEILAVPAERSRGRHNPRVVKRKMSNFPTKARAASRSGQVFHYEDHIRIVLPRHPASTTTVQPSTTGRRHFKAKLPAPSPTDRQAFWLEQIRAWQESGLSRTAYCQRHQLARPSFNARVARLRHHLRPKTTKTAEKT